MNAEFIIANRFHPDKENNIPVLFAMTAESRTSESRPLTFINLIAGDEAQET